MKHNPPAVHHDGPGVRRVHLLHLLQELQHADGWEGNAEVRPAGEVKLRDQTRCFGAVAGLLWWTQRRVSVWWHRKQHIYTHKQNRPLISHKYTINRENPLQNQTRITAADTISLACVQTYILHTEFAYGVVHQSCKVFHSNTNVSVRPASLIRPILITLILQSKTQHMYVISYH